MRGNGPEPRHAGILHAYGRVKALGDAESNGCLLPFHEQADMPPFISMSVSIAVLRSRKSAMARCTSSADVATGSWPISVGFRAGS
jgi:hypothetical protein